MVPKSNRLQAVERDWKPQETRASGPDPPIGTGLAPGVLIALFVGMTLKLFALLSVFAVGLVPLTATAGGVPRTPTPHKIKFEYMFGGEPAGFGGVAVADVHVTSDNKQLVITPHETGFPPTTLHITEPSITNTACVDTVYTKTVLPQGLHLGAGVNHEAIGGGAVVWEQAFHFGAIERAPGRLSSIVPDDHPSAAFVNAVSHLAGMSTGVRLKKTSAKKPTADSASAPVGDAKAAPLDSSRR